MKTFKLKKLVVIGHENEMVEKEIDLIDALIINKENENREWLLEIYVPKTYLDYFLHLQKKYDDLMVRATITTESNEPVTLITRFLGVNELEENMNVLLTGSFIDQRKHIIEERLSQLVEEGYQGSELIEKFKESI